MAVQPVETETIPQAGPLLTLDELRAGLQAVGEERYHHKHPFHLMMHEGQLSRGQLQAWALNRYYYQSIIPIKDSIILSRGPDPVFRRAWRKRVVDHDGDATSEGGIKRWLTELFSAKLITLRVEKLRQFYPWLSGGLDYFEARLYQAPEDAQFAVNYVYDNAKTRAEQELAIQALRDKCDILWAQLDALYFAYVQPGWPPPGAFRIEDK